MPYPDTAETTCTGTPIATASTDATSSDGSSRRSAFVSTISGDAPLSEIVTRYRSMRRGSRSGPSEDTMNARSTFAASVCDSDVRPAAFRTIALRRGSTTRTSPSPRPTQSPTATSTLSCTSRPGRLVRTISSAVCTSKAARCPAMTRPGTRPGCKLAASSRVQPSTPRSNSDKAILRFGCEDRTARRPSPKGSYARRAASRSRRPRRRQAQSACELPPLRGNGTHPGYYDPATLPSSAASLPSSSVSAKRWIVMSP